MKRIPLHYFCMSDISIIKTLTSQTIDPALFSWPTSLLTATTGTPTVASGKYRLNAQAFRSTFQILHGQVSFGMDIPAVPTTADARRWGLKGYPDTKGEAYFDITDDVFSAVVVSDKGATTTQVLPFTAGWATVETDFSICVDETTVSFHGGGALLARIQLAVGDAITSPAYIFVSNGNADNMDIGYIKMKNIGRIAHDDRDSSTVTISSIIPGTGATSLGKAEDSAHASGDVGVMALAVRQDTPATVGADGDYTFIPVEGSKGVRSTLGSLISGEDQNRNVMHVVNGGTTTRITTATTTVCRNTSGKMNGILVEVALTGTATFYDNASAASGTVLLILPIGTPAGYYSFCDGGTLSNGCVCVTSAADRLVVGCSR